MVSSVEVTLSGRIEEPISQNAGIPAGRDQKEWIPAIHSTGVEPCGNDETADSSDFYDIL